MLKLLSFKKLIKIELYVIFKKTKKALHEKAS
jgi:hypothetical protein